MHNSHTLAVASTLIITLSISSLQAEESKPKRPKRPPPIVSPTIHKDGRVTFRVKAVDAEEVQLSGEMIEGKAAMTQNDEGVWSVTLDPVEPGLYGYKFIVDGVSILDSGNQFLKPMRSPRTSVLHIPGDHSYDFKDVPHGTVHYHAYHSKPINRFRELAVYTPPGYEQESSEQYPLLVLQHGHSDRFDTWVAYGKAHWILDNLIASGKAKPMIVLMLDGHPSPESYGNGRSTQNVEELRQDMMQVALPMIESLYRVKPGRKNRAIAGLSMGGLHSLTIGLNELGTFAWIGAFSAAIPEEEALQSALKNADDVNRQLKLLWIACGREDFLLDENQAFVAGLEEAGINHKWLLTEGNHSWPIWRGYLTDFAPMLFQ